MFCATMIRTHQAPGQVPSALHLEKSRSCLTCQMAQTQDRWRRSPESDQSVRVEAGINTLLANYLVNEGTEITSWVTFHFVDVFGRNQQLRARLREVINAERLAVVLHVQTLG